jgi:hypothetical protein
LCLVYETGEKDMYYINLSSSAQLQNEELYSYQSLSEESSDKDWEKYDLLSYKVQWALKQCLPTTISTYDGFAVLGYWRGQPSNQEPRFFRLTGGLDGLDESLYIQVMCTDDYGNPWWEDWGTDYWEIPISLIRSDYRPEDDISSKDLFEVFKDMMTPK